MERFLVFLFAILSFAANAAVPGNAPILTIAAPGQNTQALSLPISQLATGASPQVFSLYGGCGTGSGAAAHFYPLYQNGLNGSTSGYRVTSGKTAYCMNVTATSSGASNSFQLVSDTAVIAGGANGTTTLTSGVYLGGAAGAYPLLTETANTPISIPGVYTFGSLTYAGVQIASGAYYYIHMDCFEQ